MLGEVGQTWAHGGVALPLPSLTRPVSSCPGRTQPPSALLIPSEMPSLAHSVHAKICVPSPSPSCFSLSGFPSGESFPGFPSLLCHPPCSSPFTGQVDEGSTLWGLGVGQVCWGLVLATYSTGSELPGGAAVGNTAETLSRAMRFTPVALPR